MSTDYRTRQRTLARDLVAGAANASVVPILGDFRNDPALCLTAVSFIEGEIASAIETRLIQRLRRIEPDHHYYRPDELHLTVKGVRVIHHPPNFDERDIQRVDGCFGAIIPDYAPIPFALEQVVRFPTSLAVVATSPQRFGDLVQALDRGLEDVGVPDDKRYASNEVFFGNVSFCRFTSQPSPEFLEAAAELDDPGLGDLIVDRVSLVVCNAVCAVESRRIRATYDLDGGSRLS